jgi:hypothetical protein
VKVHKPREEEKGTSERGNNNTRMERVLHETAGREEGRRKDGYTKEREADGDGGNRNHSGRGGKTHKTHKKRKAPGWDGVQNEAWMYGTERMVELMNGVWRGEGFPADWREGAICPIFKKGEKNRAENYRGITLLSVVCVCFEQKDEERNRGKGSVADSQAGFRKGRGTVDNVYILDHLARNELRKKGGRMCALFIDFKAAFDKVDRVKMFECMRERGISELLVRKVEEIYARTRSKVKVGEKEGEMLRKAQAGGGVIVRREKVWSLAFADDMVIVAKSEREMKEMMRNLETYVRKKKLEVNVEKTKMMVFSKRKRKNEESEWKWEESKIERVSEFKYLSYTFNERATDKAQVREVVRKANKVVGCVWGIGERLLGGEFGRRMMMFESMVESVLMYGAEI